MLKKTNEGLEGFNNINNNINMKEVIFKYNKDIPLYETTHSLLAIVQHTTISTTTILKYNLYDKNTSF